MSAALRVLQAGPLATVQDAGRHGWGRFGVPRGGALDLMAAQAANLLVGNDANTAVLEITAGGARFELLAPVGLGLAGGDLQASLSGHRLLPWTSFFARPGDVLDLPGRSAAPHARAYLSISGGFDVPMVLGSRSTCLAGGFGGFEGRPLRGGDVLVAGPATGDISQHVGHMWPVEACPRYQAVPTLRFLPGPHLAAFADDALAVLSTSAYRIADSSNRMGYRMEGLPVPLRGTAQLASCGVVPGAIQVPPDGAPILLLADAQPTGGYPICGVVIAADLPLAAQLLPGDQVKFQSVVVEEARAAWRDQQRALDALKPQSDPDLAALALAGSPGFEDDVSLLMFP